MNSIGTANTVQWLFLDINAFFASCEQQEMPALRGKPIIVVRTLTESACAIATSYPAKHLGITTGTLLREARRICPDVIPVQAYPSGEMICWPVSARVGNVKNNDPSLIDQVAS
jgi:nucleotidyltransferase/DNA polymerase involved in DNA repair